MNEHDNEQHPDLSQNIDVPHRGYETGTFVDGKNSSKSYLIVAVRKNEDTYNCVGVRRLGPNHFKFHFWPSDTFFGVEAPDRYESHRGLSVGDYVGCVTDWDGVVSLLEAMMVAEGMETSVGHPEKILKAFNTHQPIARQVPHSGEDYDDTHPDPHNYD